MAVNLNLGDANIKNTRIFKSELPPVNSNNEYLLRYRITSDDRNRISSWSPIFFIKNKPVELVDGVVSQDGNIINIVWGDEEDRPKYDIFVKFNTGDFFYHGTSQTHNYSVIKEPGATSIMVAIQIEGIEKEKNELLTIYETTTPVSLV
jgi:hypothetical protein